MQAIDDTDRPSPEAEVRPEDVRTPFDQFILTYLGQRETWILGSVLLSLVAVGIGIAGLWLTNYAEARRWTRRYLNLGLAASAGWLILISLICLWPEPPSLIEVRVNGQRPSRLMDLNGRDIIPREGYEFVYAEVTVTVLVPENGKVDESFTHAVSRSQFRMISPTGQDVPVSRETDRFADRAFPQQVVLHTGESVSGVLVFHAKEGPPTTRLLYEANPAPKTGEPTLVREFEIAAPEG